MLKDRGGVRRQSGGVEGEMFGVISIAARQASLVEAVHGPRIGVVSAKPQKKDAGDLPLVCLGLSGDTGRDRDARPRNFYVGRRRRVHDDSLFERASDV